MPHYFFDTADGDRDTDRDGTELADDDAAVREAIRYAGALVEDQPSMLAVSPELVVTVRKAETVVAKVHIAVERSGR